MAPRLWLFGGAILSLLASVHAFYLPGAAPHDYQQGEKVDLYVNTLTPMIAGSDTAKLVRSVRSSQACLSVCSRAAPEPRNPS